ncbi:MAG TPA: hypothetical protein VKR23_15935 [Gaiellaceae bacterium]|nr:hypothetical protein [Gaiellaceae bacterium]
MAERALVKNAADPQQIKRAARVERNTLAQQQIRCQRVLESYDGRAFCWDLLDMAGVYRSIWSPSAEIHYRAGRQDYGHELMAKLLAADEGLYQQMETEARARLKRDNTATDAAHTAAATEERTTDGNR